MALLSRITASLALFLPAFLAYGQRCTSFDCKHGGTCADGDADYGRLTEYQYISPNFLDETQHDGQHCECPEGWTGVACKRRYEICDEVSGFPCFHGSKCVSLGGNGGAEWGCDCTTANWMGEKEFFAGLHCEYRASDVCASMDKDGLEEGRWFCANGGSCQDDNTEVMKKCRCEDDWFGPHCEFHRANDEAWNNYNPKQCSLSCRNGGKCVFGIKNYGMHENKNDASVTFTSETQSDGMHCVCADGYTGLICQIPAKKCGKRLWCYNGAECNEATLDNGSVRKYCDCAAAATNSKSFAGLACQHQSGVFCNPDEGNREDMSFCVNGGTCWENGDQHLGCDCQDGWSGQHCEFHAEMDPAEMSNPAECKLQCMNDGKCSKGVKDYGTLEKFDVPFSDHQNFEYCLCPSGFTGVDCSVKVEFCSPTSRQVCFYGAKCVPTGEISANGKDEYICECDGALTPKGTPVAGRYCEHYATDICTAGGLSDWHSFCTNGGTCINPNVNEGEKHPGCFCPKGWGGDFCAERFDGGVSLQSTSSGFDWSRGTFRTVAAVVTLVPLFTNAWW